MVAGLVAGGWLAGLVAGWWLGGWLVAGGWLAAGAMVEVFGFDSKMFVF